MSLVAKTRNEHVVKDVTFNFKDMVATKALQTTGNVTGGGPGYLTGGVRGMTGTGSNTDNLEVGLQNKVK